MSGYRGWIEASPGPARCSLVGGGAHLLVRVRLFDEGAEDPQPEVYCDLRPDEAQQLAHQLLGAIQSAERQTREAGYWRTGR
jgi:hypothetical protein